MFTFNFTTRDAVTGKLTLHTVTENVYGIDAAWDAANERIDTGNRSSPLRVVYILPKRVYTEDIKAEAPVSW